MSQDNLIKSTVSTYLHDFKKLSNIKPLRIRSPLRMRAGLYDFGIQLVADHYASGRQQKFKKTLLVGGGRLRLHVENGIRS
jgi:hypothetical protein